MEIPEEDTSSIHAGAVESRRQSGVVAFGGTAWSDPSSSACPDPSGSCHLKPPFVLHEGGFFSS